MRRQERALTYLSVWGAQGSYPQNHGQMGAEQAAGVCSVRKEGNVSDSILNTALLWTFFFTLPLLPLTLDGLRGWPIRHAHTKAFIQKLRIFW